MSRGLLAARSHIAFLVGLAIALGVVWLVNRNLNAPPQRADAPRFTQEDDLFPARAPGTLRADLEEWGRAAWSYFERNTDPNTGLAGSVEGYPSTTMWDTGSHLLGIIGAHELGILGDAEAEGHLRKALESLARMPLCEGRAPNKAYDTRTLAMVDYGNQPVPGGIGWSAVDIGRLAVPFAIIAWRYPGLAPLAREVVGRWDVSAFIVDGWLQGATRREDGTLEIHPEGRLGYEQYAARAFMLLGMPAVIAADFGQNLDAAEVEGVRVPMDARHPDDHGGTPNPVLSEPFLLVALELGLDDTVAPLARAVLLAQQRRFAAGARPTAVSEDHLDRDPRFVYAAVISGDEPWAVVTPDGRSVPEHRIFSTKAALGWAAVFAGEYPDRLLDEVRALVEPGRGFWAGRYDADWSVNRVLAANTNGIVLETLAYAARGPLARFGGGQLARLGESR